VKAIGEYETWESSRKPQQKEPSDQMDYGPLTPEERELEHTVRQLKL